MSNHRVLATINGDQADLSFSNVSTLVAELITLLGILVFPRLLPSLLRVFLSDGCFVARPFDTSGVHLSPSRSHLSNTGAIGFGHSL